MNKPTWNLTKNLIKELSPYNISYFETTDLNGINKVYFKVNKPCFRNHMFLINLKTFEEEYNNYCIFEILYEYINTYKNCDPVEIENLFPRLIYCTSK
ncbi:hypothetical protein [Jeotgalibacillus terrae]|uniref:Uncharacterized protein n=1 Tax=Jeotgalibacillus terrae TaxID=587735 RepID=A0ABW5ZL54_9BACL|nr:hypothetical protein [Jeotgalibacillus terrae]MBM7581123.1 hypothetical protein [Jeotgalibacillus terrae]